MNHDNGAINPPRDTYSDDVCVNEHNAGGGQTMAHAIDNCLRCYKTCLQALSKHCIEAAGGVHNEASHTWLMMDCVAICQVAADFMIRGSKNHRQTCRVCADICRQCAESCDAMGEMDSCVETCRACAESCSAMSGTHA